VRYDGFSSVINRVCSSLGIRSKGFGFFRLENGDFLDVDGKDTLGRAARENKIELLIAPKLLIG